MPIGQWGLQSDEQNQRYNMQANEMNVRGQEQLGSAIGQAPQKFLQGAQQVQQMQSQKLQNQLMIAKYEQDKQELAWKMNVTAQTQQLRATEIGLQANAHALEKDKFLFNQERSKAQDKRDMGEWDLHVFEANQKAGVHKDDKGYFRSVWKDNKSQSEYLSPEESAQYAQEQTSRLDYQKSQTNENNARADAYRSGGSGSRSGRDDFVNNIRQDLAGLRDDEKSARSDLKDAKNELDALPTDADPKVRAEAKKNVDHYQKMLQGITDDRDRLSSELRARRGSGEAPSAAGAKRPEALNETIGLGAEWAHQNGYDGVKVTDSIRVMVNSLMSKGMSERDATSTILGNPQTYEYLKRLHAANRIGETKEIPYTTRSMKPPAPPAAPQQQDTRR